MAVIKRGKVIRADLAQWDGKTSTYSRVDATGGTTTGLAIGNEVDVLQVYGSGTNRTVATITDAKSKIGSSNATLVFAPGTWTIDSNLTIPSTLPCRVPAGCVFSVDAGVTLTFSGLVIVEHPATWASGSGTVTALNTIPFVRTAAEITASVTPTNYVPESGDVRRYGGVLDGATDGAAALQAACDVAAAGGPPAYIAGQLALASASLPITLESNTTIEGDAPNVSALIVTGVAGNNLFTSLNQSNIKLKNLRIRGNSTSATAYTDGMAWLCQQNTSAVAISKGFRALNCRFENFKGSYWLWFENSSATYAMRDIRIVGNEVQSETGNSRDATALSETAHFVAFQGQINGVAGLVADAVVRDNWADCEHIKGFGAAWHSTSRIRFVSNTVLNAGQTGANDDKAGYAFLAYNNALGAGGSDPDLIEVSRNIITSPRSAGLYVAEGNRVKALHNTITGQSDETDGTLPKGAIVFNDCLKAEASGNYIEDCYGGIALYGNTASDDQRARGNRIIAIREDGFGITARSTFSGKAKSYEITGNSVEATTAGTRAVFLRFTSAQGAIRLIVKDNPILSAERGIEVLSIDASVPDLKDVILSGNAIFGSSSVFGIKWDNCQDSETRALIAHNTFRGSWAAAGAMLNVVNSYGLSIIGNEFVDATGIITGFAMRTAGARGRMEGNRWNGIADARRFEGTGGEDLGAEIPTWTGERGDFVQNINPADVTGASWDYTTQGWIYTTAWRGVFAPYQDS